MFTVNQQVFVKKLDSANAVVCSTGERAIVVEALRNDGDRQMVYIQYPDRPMRHQKNRSFAQYDQVWLSTEMGA